MEEDSNDLICSHSFQCFFCHPFRQDHLQQNFKNEVNPLSALIQGGN